MDPMVENKDQICKHLDAIQVLMHANVYMLLCAAADLEPFLVLRPELEPSEALGVLKAFAKGRWNASKSL